MRKGETACNEQFLLFSQCFMPYLAPIFHLKCIIKCRLQFVSIWTSQKFCSLVSLRECRVPKNPLVSSSILEKIGQGKWIILLCLTVG